MIIKSECKSFSLWRRIKIYFKTGVFIKRIKLTKTNQEDLKGLPWLETKK